VVGTAFLLALLALFYPRTAVVTDEVCYLSVANYLVTGKAFDRSSEAWFWKEEGDHERRTLFSASPTFSALLIPFVAVGWRSTFLLGTLAHVLAFGGMIYVLHRRGFNPVWAMLYLLYPTFVLYSRMVMVDVPSAALVVLMLVLLHRERPNYFAVGLVMGFALMVKLSIFPVVCSFAGVTFLEDMTGKHPSADVRKVGLRWLWFGLGMVPAGAALAVINRYFFNSPFGNGYIGMSGGMFSWKYFGSHLTFYLIGLMTMYPLMLISPMFLQRPFRREMMLSCALALVFFSCYFFVDPGNEPLEAMVRGLRFQLIVMPFYTIAYAEMVTRLANKLAVERLLRPALAAAVVLLCAGASVISWRYFEHTRHESERQEELSRILPLTGTVIAGSKYVSPVMCPRLRVLRFAEEILFSVRPDDLPILLILERGEGTRTVAFREGVERGRERILAALRGYFELQPRGCPVEGMEAWLIVRRIRFPAGDVGRQGQERSATGMDRPRVN
jgi:hypothetical protein